MTHTPLADGRGSVQATQALPRRADATVRQIDRLVYDLYGLTEDEIRIVEEATA